MVRVAEDDEVDLLARAHANDVGLGDFRPHRHHVDLPDDDDGRRHRGPARRRPTDGCSRARAGRTATGRSEEHTSELQSLMRISYAVFCLKKKKLRPPDETDPTPTPRMRTTTASAQP